MQVAVDAAELLGRLEHPIDSDIRESLLIALRSGLSGADTVWSGAQSAEEENTETRLDQIHTLLEAEGAASAGIVAGDFNAEPGWPEIELMTGEAGYVSAVDVSGDASALTSPSIDPQHRIDWVFGRGVTFLGAEVLGDALSSDHLPLVVELRVGAPAE